jgi:orotate phosphoribosyltransferase
MFNPLELMKSAAAAASEIPGEFGAEHANVLVIGTAAHQVMDIMHDDGRDVDAAIIVLGYAEDKSYRHIAACDLCIASLKRIVSVFNPTAEEIRNAKPFES